MERKHNTDLTNNARTLRKNMTKEERHLWYDFLKNYPVRFLRQKVIDNYIWINVNKVDSKKRKNYTDISNASFWLGVRPLLCE